MMLTFNFYHPEKNHPDWSSLLREAQGLSKELLPLLDRPQKRTDFWRRRLAAGKTAIKNYGLNRSLKKRGREDFRPLYFIWTLTRVCNFSCIYCDDHTGRKYPDLSNAGMLNTAQAVELLKIMRTGTASVYFAGGEPTARPDLPALARAARDLKYFPIVLNTNGSRFHHVLKLESWKSLLADLDIVVVSLDGLSLDVLRDMWRYRNPIDVLRNLLVLRELSKELKFKLMINMVIQPGYLEEAWSVLNLANDLGIWLTPVPQNRGSCIDRRLLDDPAYIELALEILKRQQAGYRIAGSPRLNRRLLFAEKLNCRNTVKPHLDFNGRLFWPCKSSVNVAPETVDVLNFADVDSLYRHACTLVNPTGFHGPAKNQCGGNCNWAQNYTTDSYLYGLDHPFHLLREAAGFSRAV
ncbi:MAG: radical SAM protein [Elusimicrobia bacterium]|nr:radical SAM protein [Elusimicrobiota bacterium]